MPYSYFIGNCGMFNWITPEIIIAISSVFIALFALVATIWQGKMTKKHNKLSVKPILNCRVEISNHCEKIGVHFTNDGIGPAVITSAKIKRNNKEFSLGDFRYLGLFPELRNEHFHFNLLGIPGTILPSQSQWLFSTNEHKNGFVKINDLISALNEVNIEIKYESMYEDKFTFLRKIEPPQ